QEAADAFQNFVDWARNFTSPWWVNLIGGLSGLNAILGALADIAEIYAQGFAAEAKAPLDQLTWAGIQELTQDMGGKASHETLKDVAISLGVGAASIVLPFIGNIISGLGGVLAKQLGRTITQIGLAGPVAGSVVASVIWAGSYIMENEYDNDLAQQEQIAPW
ncbi:MAG TPA: hypothetical protein VFV38_48690, partial [Ktedonobacteraceae bacterium]|nr:hypothetical protein [Ktedonobacteraceae bacterium]